MGLTRSLIRIEFFFYQWEGDVRLRVQHFRKKKKKLESSSFPIVIQKQSVSSERVLQLEGVATDPCGIWFYWQTPHGM